MKGILSNSILLTALAVSFLNLVYFFFSPNGFYLTTPFWLQNLKLFLLSFAAISLGSRRYFPGWNDIKIPNANLLAGIILGVYFAISFSTPRINFGKGLFGLGYGDTECMGWMIEHFSWFSSPVTENMHDLVTRYRILTPLVVHSLGLNTFLSFAVLNFVSHVLSCLLVYKILRFYSVGERTCLAGVFFFAILKFGAKFCVYYPLVNDGLGTLLLLAVIYFTLKKNHFLYLVAMCLAVFCRENILVLTLFNLLYNIRTGRSMRGRLLAAAIQIIPWSVFIFSRKFPVFPLAFVDKTSAVNLVLYWRIPRMLFAADCKLRLVLAHLNALGVLVMVPFFVRGKTAEFLKNHYEWIAYVSTTFALAVVAGGDLDRYASWQAPFLIILVFNVLRDKDAEFWLSLMLIQSIAMEFIFPWLPDRDFYLSLTASHCTFETNAYRVLFSLVLYLALRKLFEERSVR